MSERVTIEISEADMAELREWAHNSEQSVEALVEVALQQYMIAVREDHADLEERMKGPFYPLEEVEARLAERRRRFRSEAAE
jgi:predicted transcriptional regulator